MKIFASRRNSPGHRVRVSARGQFDPVFKVRVGAVRTRFKTKGTPNMMGVEGRYQSLFDPKPIDRHLFKLAIAVLEAEEQYAQTDYPDIYRERMEDLTARDRAALAALAAWPKLSAVEAKSLESSLVEELKASRDRWASLNSDLVDWTVKGGGRSGIAGHVRSLLHHEEESAFVYEELDRAYEEYKRIYREAYEDAAKV